MNETTFDHEFFPPSQPSNLERNSISILETKENNSKGIENTTDPTIEQLQLQLHSYNKIQQLQDKMISKNHSNQYDLVLTRWRQKVLQLMIENKFMEKEYTETINKLILENKELKDKGTIKQITKLDASDEKHYKDDLTSEDIISMEMLKKDLISKDREISILQEDLQSKEDEIFRYQEELKSKNANINELQDHLHSNQTQQDAMSNQILELQSKLQFKESQLKEWNNKLNEQNQQIVEQTQTISRLTSGYNPTTSASPSNHTQQQNINPTLQDVVHQQKSKLIECLENHIQSIQHKLIDFHTHQGKTNENTNDWSDPNNFLPNPLSDNKSESNEVKTIVELENHVELLRKEINRLSRVEELELELRILQSQMCNNSKEKKDTNEITILKTQIEDMQQKTIKWKKQVSIEFSKQNKMISNQQNEIDELNQEIEELVIALENKAEKYNDLEAKLMDVIDRSDEDMTELRNEILDLQSQLESKNDSLLFDRNVYMKEKVKEISSRMLNEMNGWIETFLEKFQTHQRLFEQRFTFYKHRLELHHAVHHSHSIKLDRLSKENDLYRSEIVQLQVDRKMLLNEFLQQNIVNQTVAEANSSQSCNKSNKSLERSQVDKGSISHNGIDSNSYPKTNSDSTEKLITKNYFETDSTLPKSAGSIPDFNNHDGGCRKITSNTLPIVPIVNKPNSSAGAVPNCVSQTVVDGVMIESDSTDLAKLKVLSDISNTLLKL